MMNVMRGCGLSGLRGIEEIQDQNGYLYIRPLLQESRESIEQYLKDQKIKARIDESNFDNTYTRNKIRNVVLPYIEKEFNPNIITSVDRMSNIIKEEDEFLDNITQSVFLETCISYNLVAEEGFENVLDKLEKDRKGKRFNQIILDLRKFNAQHPVIQKRLVLKAIQRLFGTTQGIEQVHVQDIVKLCNNNIGNKYLTPNKFTQIVIKNKKIYLNRLK
jgi:tRNA(Ile)-lysidine synthase